MTKKVFNMEGGLHSAAAYSAFENRSYSSCKASLESFVVSAGTGLNANIAPGDGLIDTGDSYARRIQSDATESVLVGAGNASFNRIDSIVAFIDNSVVIDPDYLDNTNDVLKFACVAGTAASTPVAPSGGTIQAAVGAGNPYLVLSNVLVPQNAVNLSGATFTDVAKVAGGGLASILTFTSSGSYAKPAGLKFVIIEIVGGGGGGGGCASGSGNGAAGGGGGGGYARKKIMANQLASSVTVTIGNAGNGGNAGNNAGGAGGNTSFGSHATGNGGAGGAGLASLAASNNAGGAGGTATGGDLNIGGRDGDTGTVLGGNRANWGMGGASYLGLGGKAAGNGSGFVGTGYGAGGGGAASLAGSYWRRGWHARHRNNTRALLRVNVDFGPLLSAYGLPGIIIFALGCVVVVLYRENRALIKQLFDVQEQRRLEGLETARELNKTMASFSQATTQLIDKIEIVRGSK